MWCQLERSWRWRATMGMAMTGSLTGSGLTTAGLTTGDSPFIEQAKRAGQLYIEQPYELYSEENHQAWRKLYARMLPRWDRYANQHFLKGIHSLCLNPDRTPRREAVEH